MSVWIELMCDKRKDGTDPKNILQSRCWTNRNENIMGRARTASKAPEAIRVLIAEAQRKGWLVVGGEFICPGCR